MALPPWPAPITVTTFVEAVICSASLVLCVLTLFVRCTWCGRWTAVHGRRSAVAERAGPRASGSRAGALDEPRDALTLGQRPASAGVDRDARAAGDAAHHLAPAEAVVLELRRVQQAEGHR